MSKRPTPLSDLVKSALYYREQKGFVPVTWDTLPYRLCCLTDELFELECAMIATETPVAEFRVDPEKYESCLRDVVFEVGDLLLYAVTISQDVFGDCSELRSVNHVVTREEAAVMLFPLRKYQSYLFRAWRRNNQSEARTALDLYIGSLAKLYEALLWDAPEHVVDCALRKLAASVDRPVLHGSKDPRT